MTSGALASGTYNDIGCIDIGCIHWLWLHWHRSGTYYSDIGALALTLAGLTMTLAALTSGTYIDIGCIGIDIGCIDIDCIDIGCIDIGCIDIDIGWHWLHWHDIGCGCIDIGYIDIGISSIGIVIESMAALALEVRTGNVSIRSFSWFVCGRLLWWVAWCCLPPCPTPWSYPNLPGDGCSRQAVCRVWMLIVRQSWCCIVCTPVSCPQSLVVPHKGTNALCFRLFSWFCCSTGLLAVLYICVWIPVTFHDFSEVFFSCYCGHTLNNSLCLWKRRPFTGTNRRSGCDHGNKRQTPQRCHRR